MRDRTYKGVSLFSGAGGLDVGFEQAGVEVVFANELDPDAADAYCANRPDNPNVMHRGDIVAFSDELEAMENIDVLFGGPPCQGFSVAGKMDPDDERSLLVFAFLDAVATVRPRLFVMENVKALGRSPRWESVRERLNSIAHSLGYETQPMVLDATDYGVPQKRERFFFVGIRQDTAHEALSNLPSRLQLHAAKGATVRSTLSALPRFGDAGNPESSVAAVRLAKNPILRPSAYHGSLLFNGRGRPMDLDAPAKTLPAQMGGNHTPIVDQALLDDPDAFDWVSDYHSKLLEGTTTPQEAQGGLPSSIRRLTVREAAALQTFPPDYHFSGSVNKQYRQIGNAVPCRLAHAVAASSLSLLLDGVQEIPEALSRRAS